MGEHKSDFQEVKETSGIQEQCKEGSDRNESKKETEVVKGVVNVDRERKCEGQREGGNKNVRREKNMIKGHTEYND